MLRVFSLLAAAAAAHAGSAPLTLLTNDTARCMDGTLSGYYYQPASTPRGQNTWVIYLQGGGECTTKNACYANLNTSLGSSKHFGASSNFDDEGNLYAMDDASANPDFYDAHHVNVPYCSQDLHCGQVTQPSNSTWGLYFSGRFVFLAIIDELESKYGLSNASTIVLTGASAGGIGIWPHLDWLQERYPAARVVGAPVAGFYFWAYPYTGINHTSSSLANFSQGAWPATYALWQAYTDESCAAAHPSDPWYCMLSNYSFPYISVGTFATEAQTDQVVLTDHDWLPQQWISQPPEQAYMTAWHNNMSIALSPLALPSNTHNGVFSPACFIHTSFDSQKPLINGLNYLQAFGNWFYQRTGPTGYKLQDNCGIMCNPTCP